MLQLIHTLHDFVWSPGMLVFFLASGLRFTIKSRFFQITKIHSWFSNTVGTLNFRKKPQKNGEKHSISQFQAFCTALAATLGTGNITGVATALIFGGPGAIFWMWVSAFLGMMTTYAENYLGIKYRHRDENGKWKGGAMMYMEKGLSSKFLAVFFAVCCLGASLGMGNMVQGNAMAKGLEKAFRIPSYVTGIVCMAGIASVLNGGIKGIAGFTEKLIPIAASGYLCASFFILFSKRSLILDALKMILFGAFDVKSAVGAAAGYEMKQAVRMGIARGIFSNEAGLGSSVMAHVDSEVSEPEIQGMWGILEVFLDTMVMCTVTALVILVSGVYQPEVYLKGMREGVEIIDGTSLAGSAFAMILPHGDEFLVVETALFAFATMVGWYYFGEQTAAYLGGKKCVKVFRFLYILLTLPGCMLAPQIVWELSDILNGMMAFPNLLALFFLGNEVRYVRRKN